MFFILAFSVGDRIALRVFVLELGFDFFLPASGKLRMRAIAGTAGKGDKHWRHFHRRRVWAIRFA